MPILTKEDLIGKITAFVGEEQNDDAISLIEDVTDTINDFESRAKDNTNWKEKYENNDKEWRARYIERFNRGVDEDDSDEPEDVDEPPKRFEDLFTVKEN